MEAIIIVLLVILIIKDYIPKPNKKEKIDVLMTIMKRYVQVNRKNYFMKSFCRSGIKMTVLQIQKMENWLQRYWMNI